MFGELEEKVKVFISSKCGGKYTYLRKGLKKLFYETGLIHTYVFESATGSSVQIPDAYLREIDNSNLCIFLIDNADGVTEPVLAEYSRATHLNKHIICFFCDENKKEATQLQLDIINNKSHKFNIVHEFADLYNIVYNSVINEIISTYIYDKSIQIDSDISNEIDISADTSINEVVFPKKFISNYENTTKTLMKGLNIQYYPQDNNNSCELDKVISEFSNVVLFNKKYCEDEFKKITKYIIELYPDHLKKIIELRFSAFRYYWIDDMDKCVEHLSNALKEISPSTPTWLTNDIAIDLRNMINIKLAKKNQFTFKNDGQLFIDESSQKVYFPIIDRIGVNMQEEVIKKYNKNNFKTPYETFFYDNKYFFDYISQYYSVALFHSSITHILFLKDYIISFFNCVLAERYNANLILQIIKFHIINRKTDDLDKLLRKEVNVNLTTDNIQMLIESVELIPTKHHKEISQYILLSYLGYYFSDKQFSNFSTLLIQKSFDWVGDSNSIVDIGKHIFKMFTKIIYRLDHNTVTEYIINILESPLARFYDDAYKLSLSIKFNKISNANLLKLKNVYIDFILNNKNKDIHYFNKSLLNFRGIKSINFDDLDAATKSNMNSFYNNKYNLLQKNKSENKLEKLNNLISQQRSSNSRQGKNGVYFSPDISISNLINFTINNEILLDESNISELLDLCIQTIKLSTQTDDVKCQAMILISLLSNSYNSESIDNSAFQKIAIEDIYTGRDSMSIYGVSRQYVNLILCLSKYTVLGSNTEQCLFEITNITSFSEKEQIEFSRLFVVILEKYKPQHKNDAVLNAIIIVYLSLINDNNKDVRYHSIRMLLNIKQKSRYNDLIMNRLQPVMDNGSYSDKLAIINNIESITKNSLEEYTLNKAKVDSHYLVRMRAVEIIEKFSINCN